MTKRAIWVWLPWVAAMSACAGSGAERAGAEAVLKPTQGSSVAGMVSFRQEGDAVVVTA